MLTTKSGLSRNRVDLEMFNPSEEEVVLYENTHTALVHPVDIEDTELHEKTQPEKEKSSVRKITKRELLPEELQRVCKETQYDLSKQEKSQLSRLLHKYKAPCLA